MLGLPFYDLDALIESETGNVIREIFIVSGEKKFRELETACLIKLLQMNRSIIISLGGGCLLEESNLLSVREHGLIFTLTASPEILLRRRELQQGKRPLAKDRTALLKLLKERKHHYDSLPNSIDTTNLSPIEVASRISDIINNDRHCLF